MEPLNIVICGAAGRMGKRLVALTLEAPDLRLVAAIDAPDHPDSGRDAGLLAGAEKCAVSLSDWDTAAPLLPKADAIIDFSTPVDVLQRATAAVEADCAVVIGVTGIPEDTQQALEQLGKKGKILIAPNMSVGVNLLFVLCEQVAGILGDDYDIEVVEMHHNQKKDAPSGTAKKLGEILTRARELSSDAIVHGRHGITGARSRNEIGMHALRGGDVVGDHTVSFATAGERLELTHRASSRDTFAAGALRAARFLVAAPMPNSYSMRDVLGL